MDMVVFQETAIYLEVGALSVNAGQDQAACFGSSFTLTASGSGQATCKIHVLWYRFRC